LKDLQDSWGSPRSSSATTCRWCARCATASPSASWQALRNCRHRYIAREHV